MEDKSSGCSSDIETICREDTNRRLQMGDNSTMQIHGKRYGSLLKTTFCVSGSSRARASSPSFLPVFFFS